MIEPFKGSRDLSNLLFALQENVIQDFYFTENNQRVYITSIENLKKLLKNASFIYCQKESECVTGAILVWKSVGGDVERFYVKISAPNPEEAEKLLTVLLWNYKKPLFVKVKKGSPLETVYKSKGFRYEHGRGTEVLLKKDAIVIKPTKGKEFSKESNASQVEALRQEATHESNHK